MQKSSREAVDELLQDIHTTPQLLERHVFWKWSVVGAVISKYINNRQYYICMSSKEAVGEPLQGSHDR